MRKEQEFVLTQPISIIGLSENANELIEVCALNRGTLTVKDIAARSYQELIQCGLSRDECAHIRNWLKNYDLLLARDHICAACHKMYCEDPTGAFITSTVLCFPCLYWMLDNEPYKSSLKVIIDKAFENDFFKGWEQERKRLDLDRFEP